jgi:tRNA 2-thiouridine synthesizing protein A
MSDTTFDYELDAKGLMCPEPVMMLHKQIRSMKSGEVVKVEATDPSTTRDIPQFCNMLEHTLRSQAEVEKTYTFYIEKK